MRILSWLVSIPVALAAISFALSNREPVTLSLWPLPFELSLPLYLVVLVALVLGFVVGGLIAWAGQHRHRATARRERRRADQLEQELQAARTARAEAERRLTDATRDLSRGTAMLPDAADRRERLRLAAR